MSSKTAMEPKLVKITSLKPDPKNVRLHNARNIGAIKSSLEKFGQVKPVVALKDGTVIAGNGTLQAAGELGWTELAVVTFGNAKEARAYALADNKTAELGQWDKDGMGKLIGDLQTDGFDMVADFGFDKAELDRFSDPGDGLGAAVQGLPSGGRNGFQQMTFTVSDEQAEIVKEAVKHAAKQEDPEKTGNKNRNGNGLAHIARKFLEIDG